MVHDAGTSLLPEQGSRQHVEKRTWEKEKKGWREFVRLVSLLVSRLRKRTYSNSDRRPVPVPPSLCPEWYLIHRSTKQQSSCSS